MHYLSQLCLCNYPMEREAIFNWLQIKWNTMVASLAREHLLNKCAQLNLKGSASAVATAIASSLRTNSLEISTPYESVASRALYVLLHRAVSCDCPLTGHDKRFAIYYIISLFSSIEREQYLLNFVGSHLESGGSSFMISSRT